MPSQRIILGIGLAILLIIGAARSVWISSRGPITRRRPCARSSCKSRICARCCAGRKARRGPSRSPAIRNSPGIPRGQRRDLPALAALIEAVKDNPTEKQLIEETKALVERQIAVNGELISSDRGRQRGRRSTRQPGRPRGDGRDRRNLAKAVAEERRLLFARRADPKPTGCSCWRSISPASR